MYTLTLKAAGVPPSVVADMKPYLGNMLGLIRGNIYYNLMNWYRCISALPVGDTSKFMETMMGVKQVCVCLGGLYVWMMMGYFDGPFSKLIRIVLHTINFSA